MPVSLSGWTRKNSQCVQSHLASETSLDGLMVGLKYVHRINLNYLVGQLSRLCCKDSKQVYRDLNPNSDWSRVLASQICLRVVRKSDLGVESD